MTLQRVLLCFFWIGLATAARADILANDLPLELNNTADPALENYVMPSNTKQVTTSNLQNSKGSTPLANGATNRQISSSISDSSVIGGIVRYNTLSQSPGFLDGPQNFSPNGFFRNTKAGNPHTAPSDGVSKVLKNVK